MSFINVLLYIGAAASFAGSAESSHRLQKMIRRSPTESEGGYSTNQYAGIHTLLSLVKYSALGLSIFCISKAIRE